MSAPGGMAHVCEWYLYDEGEEWQSSCCCVCRRQACRPLPVKACHGCPARVSVSLTVTRSTCSWPVARPACACGIDAPERNPPGGREATQYLKQRVLEARVMLECGIAGPLRAHGGRCLPGGGANINLAMVRNGHAWACRSYMRREDGELRRLEEVARGTRTGLWQLRHAPTHALWQHRATRGRGPFTDFSRATVTDCLQQVSRRR